MSEKVKAKKYLGQHFLTDNNIAQRIVNSICLQSSANVLEIGPGMGVLSKFLINNPQIHFKCVEIDAESVNWLKNELLIADESIIFADFLKLDLSKIFNDQFSIIGNFPYNISSQILFHVLENRDFVTELVGMFQKEVALRISAASGSKTYGILSVLCQAFYDIEYLFTVNENVFSPPPKVKSAVISLKRKNSNFLLTEFNFFKLVVKTTFNQRRKMLRNSLKALNMKFDTPENQFFLDKRPEQLNVSDFDTLCQNILNNQNKI